MKGFTKLVILWFLLVLAAPAVAQLDNRAFTEEKPLAQADSGRLTLWLQGLTYFRNNEYFNPPAAGYTLIGYQFIPRLSLQLGPRLRAEAGLFVRQEHGDHPIIRQVMPIFTLQARLDSLEIVMGTLQGSLSHGLIEPLYHFENLIQRRIEQGLQLRYKRGPLRIDTWLNWVRYLPPGANFKEEFLVGSVNSYTPRMSGPVQAQLHLQVLFSHRGGQISTDTSAGHTALHLAPGFSLYTRGWPQLRLDYYFVHYATSQKLDYMRGQGHYPNLSLNWPRLRLMASYWQGCRFVSAWGDPRFQSVAEAYATPQPWEEPTRQVLIGRLLYDLALFGRNTLTLRFEPHYDLRQGTLDYNYGVYVNLLQPVVLRRFVALQP